jgi:hypothetical protein
MRCFRYVVAWKRCRVKRATNDVAEHAAAAQSGFVTNGRRATDEL